jgi:hypothetical protein
MSWNTHQLPQLAAADDCRIAPFREDGVTPGTPTFIWSVVSGDNVYVRAYSGQRSSWYRAAVAQRAGQMHMAGATHTVRFEPVDGEAVNDAIDNAYRSKYANSRYLASMVSDRARAATVRVMPESD